MQKILKEDGAFEKILIFSVFLILPLIRLPFFDNASVVAKWKVVHLFALIALGFILLVRRSITLSKLGRGPAILLSLIAGLWVWNTIYHGIPWLSSVTSDRLVFLISCLFFCQFFRKNPASLLLISKVLALSGVAFIVIILLNAGGEWKELLSNASLSFRKKFSFPFSNENMAAQFLGLAFMSSLFLFSQSKKIFMQFFTAFLGGLFLFFLCKTGCRSVFLGSMGGGLLYGVWHIPAHFRRKVMMTAVGFFAV